MFSSSSTFTELNYNTALSILEPHVREFISSFIVLSTTFIGPNQDVYGMIVYQWMWTSLYTFLNNFLSLATKTFLLVKTSSVFVVWSVLQW